MSELPPECDYCGAFLDDGETLTSIYIGDPPEPPDAEFVGHSKIPQRYPDEEARHRAIHRALDDIDRADSRVSVDLQIGVPVMTIGDETPVEQVDTKRLPFEQVDEIEDSVKISFSVDAVDYDPEPDVQLCPICVEVFSDG